MLLHSAHCFQARWLSRKHHYRPSRSMRRLSLLGAQAQAGTLKLVRARGCAAAAPRPYRALRAQDQAHAQEHALVQAQQAPALQIRRPKTPRTDNPLPPPRHPRPLNHPRMRCRRLRPLFRTWSGAAWTVAAGPALSSNKTIIGLD